jgi:hypothetical protein
MLPYARDTAGGTANRNVLLAYVADLELEVDHLRKQGQLVQQETRDALKRILRSCAGTAELGEAAALTQIAATAQELAGVLREMREPAGYHPAHDQVVAIAVRPLAEQVFRWQQRAGGRSPGHTPAGTGDGTCGVVPRTPAAHSGQPPLQRPEVP